MANIDYQWSRLEPRVKTIGELENVVVDLVVGLTATNGTHSAYVDELIKLPEPDASNFIPFNSLSPQWAMEWAEKVSEENGWKESLKTRIETQAETPVSTQFSWQKQ